MGLRCSYIKCSYVSRLWQAAMCQNSLSIKKRRRPDDLITQGTLSNWNYGIYSVLWFIVFECDPTANRKHSFCTDLNQGGSHLRVTVVCQCRLEGIWHNSEESKFTAPWKRVRWCPGLGSDFSCQSRSGALLRRRLVLCSDCLVCLSRVEKVRGQQTVLDQW